MKTPLSCTTTIVVSLVISFSLVAFAQDKARPEAYSAVAIGTGGSVGAKTISFNFRVTQYTTDEELQNFAQLVKDKGTNALRRALEKEDRGRINPVTSTGNQIAVARKRQQGADTIITIVTARNMPFVELYRNGRTTDYAVDGKMIGGFAFVAYPAEYGNSGVMTFIINQDGVLLQKDLGKTTTETATAMTEFDPDSTWSMAEE
jgi:DUF2950 family protein